MIGLLTAILLTFLIGIFCIKWVWYLRGYGKPIILGNAISRIKTSQKVIALTYDDGPNPPYTDEILNVLKANKVKATFFLVGNQLQKHPDYVQKISNQGHELGNHSWSHSLLMFKKPSTIRKEIVKTDHLIHELGYAKDIPVRAPYGTGALTLYLIIRSLGKQQISFDIIPHDWSNPGVKIMVDRVLRNVQPGAIILLHDGGGNRSQTIEATKQIISALHDQGYRFVTISELLAMRSS